MLILIMLNVGLGFTARFKGLEFRIVGSSISWLWVFGKLGCLRVVDCGWGGWLANGEV